MAASWLLARQYIGAAVRGHVRWHVSSPPLPQLHLISRMAVGLGMAVGAGVGVVGEAWA